MDEAGLRIVVLAVLILVSSLGGWLATRRIKKKLEQGLGRKVKDEDILSISTWMKADDQVVDSVIQEDDSSEHAVENAMEDAFSNWAASQDRKKISFKS